MGLRYMVMDFDAFFASVEQQLQPELRGQPVGVVPVMAETTCCIAASYEAKRHGVKTGTAVWEAQQRCPNIRLTLARHKQYVEFHHRALAAVEPILHVEEVMSIDELYGLLPPQWQSEAEARARALMIKRALAEAIGPWVRASIGIGPNRFAAKMASKMDKPNGLTLLREQDLPQALERFELEDIYGIGHAMDRRLREAGIHAVAQLNRASKDALWHIWGSVEGSRLYRNLRGEEVELPPTQRRTVGHSHVLAPALRNARGAYGVLHRLVQKAAARLRDMDHYAGCLWVGLSLKNRRKWGAEVRFFPTQHTAHFTQALNMLWAQRPRDSEIVKVSLCFTHLEEAAQHTPSFFPDLTNPRHAELDAAVDKVNRTFGVGSLYYGSAHEGIDAAPMRIAFTQIPNLELERDRGDV